MTTDTKAVARWGKGLAMMHSEPRGDYVLFTDHEQVVAELNQKADDTEYLANLLNEEVKQLRSALAAKGAEVEGLRKDAERYRWLRDVLRHDHERWQAVVDHNQKNVSVQQFGEAIDAAMEKSND